MKRFWAIASLACLPALGQAPAIFGTVTNKTNGQKLAGVTVTLAKAGLTGATDSLGAYRLGASSGLIRARAVHRSGPSLSLRGALLELHAKADAFARLSVFDLRGNRLAYLFRGRIPQGIVPVTLPAGPAASGVRLLRLEADGSTVVYEYLPASHGGSSPALLERDPLSADAASAASESAGPASAAGAAKTASPNAAGRSAAALDTLRVSRAGYKSVEAPLDAYGLHDVALEAEGTGCAAGVLCWDFEEGRIPDGWTAYRNEFTGTLLVDGTKPHKGAFALHAKDFVGGKEGVQGGPKKTLKYALPANFGPVLWGRAYVFTSPARPESHAGLFNARYPRPGSASTAVNTLDWYEFATYQQTYMAVWHPPEPPGFPEWVLHSDKPVVLDWTCLEWSFDGANGMQAEAADPRVWVDGFELSWPDTFTFSDPAGAAKPKLEKAANFTFLETGVYLYQGLSQTTNWWIDDLAVGSRRIGCN